MKQKRYLISFLAVLAGTLLFSTFSHAASEGEQGVEWLTDFEAAQAQAKAEDKAMLVNFTGSDWCGWCIKLDKEVFSKPAFQSYAAENLVLVEIDFPRSKKQSAELKEQNEALAEKHGIRGFPTILVMDGDGQVIKRTGYRRGGAESYVQHLKEILTEEE